MPTAGPYGITQVDVPGVIGMYQQAQQNRIQMMLTQKQMAKLDRDEANQAGVQKAVAAYSRPSSQPQGAPSAVPADPLAPLPAASAAPAPTQPAHTAADREHLFASLMAIDPQVAGQYMDAFSKMDQAQVDQFKQKNTGIMQVAAGLLQLDPAQRKQALQQAAPELRQYGFTEEQIAQFYPSDQNLRQLIVSHTDADKIAQFVKPEINSVPQGGSLVSTDPTGTSKTVFESPSVTGPGGEPYARPPAMSTMMPTVQTPEEAAKLPPGTQFKLPDGRIGTVPGGAGGDASGGFP